MAVDWVGAKPGIFINNSVVTPIDADNMNSIVNTVDKIAQGGTDSGLDAETLQGKSLDSLITPSDESLVNFYSFDALCNTSPCQIDDNSGNQKYGTAYNVTPVKGVIGLAGSFNGTTSYATGSYLNLSALTISFWYKGSLNASNKPLFILKKASNATKIGIYNNNKYVKVIFTDTDGVVQNFSDTDQLDAEFHQITVSHTGTKCSIYVDGVLKISLSQTLTSLYYNEWVAGVNETQDNFSQMILDDIRIYNKALSDEEIYGQYITKIGAKVDSIVPKYINDTFVKLTGNETVAGIKTFSSSPVVPTASSSTQATNYGQVVKNSGNETIAGVKNFTSTPTVNSSPVRTDAIDSTIRSSISFTLPAMPDGARKRILNTHATNAITVTAYSGTTIEGQATMTLSAGNEVEIELIGTDWKKTGWNEKSLASFIVPVDCTSRVAEYTGDGIPLIPDNEAGRTYFQDEWATTDGFSSPNGTISVSGGNLVFNKTTTVAYNILADKSLSFSAKVAYLRVTALQDLLDFYLGGLVGSDNTIIASTGSIKAGETKLVSGYDAGTYTTLRLLAHTSTAGQTGELAKVDVVYIGTGAYDTPALDRAGNGNNLTLNAVTPVNGKYGKEMSFNGSTSYAQASSPVIGTTGTVAIRFKLNSTAFGEIVSNADANSYNGIRVRPSAGILGIVIGGVSSNQVVAVGSINTNYHTLVFTWNGSTVSYTIDNLYYTATQTVAMSASSLNMNLGRKPSGADLLDGIISHFRYDSRIWTADEARAWSLNPISIDSRV